VATSTNDGHIREVRLDATGWHIADLTALTGGPSATTAKVPSGYVRADKVNTVVYEGSAPSHLIELALVGSTWTFHDLTAIVGGR
jgi:hypothetical protein